jgi:hypothetical protein
MEVPVSIIALAALCPNCGAKLWRKSELVNVPCDVCEPHEDGTRHPATEQTILTGCCGVHVCALCVQAGPCSCHPQGGHPRGDA